MPKIFTPAACGCSVSHPTCEYGKFLYERVERAKARIPEDPKSLPLAWLEIRCHQYTRALDAYKEHREKQRPLTPQEDFVVNGHTFRHE